MLRDLDLDLRAGDGVTLLGENGAGKTTLLRLIATALSPTRGEGRVFGYDLRDRRSVRDHVHFLSHESGLYPDLTPRENLDFALRMHGRTGDVEGILRRVGLQAAQDRRVRFLSAGMRKRVTLARLAVLRQPLLLVDEPFANLDTAGRELTLELLSEARAAGAALMLAAHEPELATRVTDRSLLLRGGSTHLAGSGT